jgi:hypothetical protein
MASFSRTWDETYENNPKGGSTIRSGDNDIRHLKVDIRERITREHYMEDSETSEHGYHRKGSAIAYDSDPGGARPDGTSLDSSVDKGRLRFDFTNNEILVWDGSSWVSIQKISSTLTVNSLIIDGGSEITKIETYS